METRHECVAQERPADGQGRGTACSTTPFGSDLDYMQEEVRWVEARCQRIAAGRRLATLAQSQVDGVARPPGLAAESADVLEARRDTSFCTKALCRFSAST